jgi:hypothetical protein
MYLVAVPYHSPVHYCQFLFAPNASHQRRGSAGFDCMRLLERTDFE